MSESVVGWIEPVTRHAVTAIGGVAPGGSKVPAGTTAASVIVVSGRLTPARLSQAMPAAAAGTEKMPSALATAIVRDRFMTASLFQENPGAQRVLLLEPGLRPVAHAGREDRLQPRPLRGREGLGVVRGIERLALALDDVGGDIGAGHLARERVRRIERVARRDGFLLADLNLRNEYRRRVARVAAFL